MEKTFEKMLEGYRRFREKYAAGDTSLMQQLADNGQKPQAMVVACCDSRVDPSVILQCGPGELFVTRNVANIVPPYECDAGHHGTSTALEYGICYLNVKHLIILGHSQCGGIDARINGDNLKQDDFISRWVSIIETDPTCQDVDECAKHALSFSYNNCLSFPWIKSRVEQNQLSIHQWFFDIKSGEILVHEPDSEQYHKLVA